MYRPSETRDKLLDTAIELVWRSNYGNVGVNEICEKAGVTKGSFYHHFDSKAELFRAASEHSWQKTKIDMDAIFSPENDALARLEGWLDLLVAKLEVPLQEGDPVAGCPFFTSGAQCGNDEPVVRQVAIDMVEKCLVYYSALIRSLQAEGHVINEVSADQMGRFLMHFVQGALLYGRVMRDPALVVEDLRLGVYCLIGLKPSLRQSAIGPGVKTSAFA